ncbi:LysR family transcriptional regulator [Dickeya zeae]|uniref:LysR family transcriptional regulator n=1 Tax=Dickeya zeae TaxID=204042 RepID=A0AAE6Z339_9GAMM|nr:LysR substrate-binding domain-containing protein [Dickeya zeae]QIZ53157.1 LysR family transcriptional regulator [Dickeya zeae]
MKRLVTLDLDALRSFVAGVELGSFALAAQQLSRSTSAVSAHLKKLEQQCDATLLRKEGRHLKLTDSGEILLNYAHKILAVNDEAMHAVRGARVEGEVRFGMQEDFGESLMPDVLGRFARAYPGVQISARIARNRELCEALSQQQLDLALSWLDEESMPGIAALAHLPMRWIRHPSFEIADYLETGRPLPLVMFEAPCLMRRRGTDALDKAGIPWRVVFVSRSLSGIWAAVNAGLGVTVRSAVGMPSSLTAATHNRLPPLPEIGVALLQAPASLPDATARLKQLLEEELSHQLPQALSV